jgi:aromatic-L-amino-acid/L-tryptophan decarboxylase
VPVLSGETAGGRDDANGGATAAAVFLAGRYDVFIDTRLIRTHGPGDHFGELAARDWGAGYGYARLATVRCTEPGRLLKLTTEDLAWLVDSQPAVKARIAATLAERLQNR